MKLALPRVDDETLRRAAKIRLIVLDVDGVLTDGAVRFDSDGGESRDFYVRDGLGIRLAQRAGLQFGIISGRESPLVARRAAELDIAHVYQRVSRKTEPLTEMLDRLELDAESACFVGDDLIDLPPMRMCGFAAAPGDGAPEVLAEAHYVTERRGGRGAVREVVDLILRASNRWDDVIREVFR